MKPPKYTSLVEGGEVVQCSICGCVVAHQANHTSFHDALARLLGIVDGTLAVMRGN